MQAAQTSSAAAAPPYPPIPQRYLALDAYRGFIMLVLVSGGFGLEALARRNGPVKEDPRISQMRAEKARVEEALKELAIENTLLRKKVG